MSKESYHILYKLHDGKQKKQILNTKLRVIQLTLPVSKMVFLPRWTCLLNLSSWRFNTKYYFGKKSLVNKRLKMFRKMLQSQTDKTSQTFQVCNSDWEPNWHYDTPNNINLRGKRVGEKEKESSV